MGFESFLGNERAVATLREMLARDRLPGALLFAGPDGVGKKTLALMFSKAIFCERRQAGLPAGALPAQAGESSFCGACARCRKAEEMFVAARDDLARRRELKDAQSRVEGLVYFDLQLIAPLTRFTLVEQVRLARKLAYTRPFEFSRRIIIFDQAQSIHWQAADILLKMLEEPPETTILILICPNAHELHSTIRSRCLRVQFVPVEENIIAELLANEKKVPTAQVALAARLVAGSVARAKTLDLAEYERRRRPWLDYLDSVAPRPKSHHNVIDFRSLFDATRALGERNENFEETLRIGMTLLRDLMVVLEGHTDRNIVNLDLAARLQSWAERLRIGGIERIKRGLDQAYRLQKRNVNQQLGLESLAIEILEDLLP